MSTLAVVLSLLLASVAPNSRASGDSASAHDRRPSLHFAGDAVALGMPDKGGRSLVEVHIGAAGPFDFLIDTGAGVSVIDAKIASDLRLAVVGRQAVGVPGGEPVETEKVHVPVLLAGGLEVRDAEPVALEIAQMTGGLIQGVLGLELFREVILTLDPGADRAVVSRGRLTPGTPGVIHLDAASGRIKFDMSVAGRTVATQIDTGSPAGFTLPIGLIDSVPTRAGPERQRTAGLVGGSRTVRIKKLDGAIQFGGLDYENPEVGFMDPSPPTANIGSAILSDLVITVDQRNQLLAFRRAEPSRQPAASDSGPGASGAPRRLGIRFRGSPTGGFTHVDSVDPGSLGERAGFKAGDVLVSLNERPISEYDLTSLGTLLRGATPLRWEVDRDGARQVIAVP